MFHSLFTLFLLNYIHKYTRNYLKSPHSVTNLELGKMMPVLYPLGTSTIQNLGNSSARFSTHRLIAEKV